MTYFNKDNITEDKSKYIPKEGSVILVANCGDILPRLGVFEKISNNGIWAVVDTGKDFLESMKFDMMYSDVTNLDETLGAFIDERNNCIEKQQQEDEEEEKKMILKKLEKTIRDLLGDKWTISVSRYKDNGNV